MPKGKTVVLGLMSSKKADVEPADAIRKRMSTLHKKNQFSFNTLSKNSTLVSEGELHKWVLQQASLA